ncbi:hypothetical protein NMD1_02112 [Novosphingobium sp. MD-1]|nr:hypothetical protein NMD1_02112 [Novosphingobium sp. MD-1]
MARHCHTTRTLLYTPRLLRQGFAPAGSTRGTRRGMAPLHPAYATRP